MGFLDFLTGKKNTKQETSSTSTTDVDKSGTQTQSQTETQAASRKGTTSTSGTTAQQLAGTTLSQQDIEILSGLTQALSGSQDDPFFADATRSLQLGSGNILDTLFDKATGGLDEDRDIISQAFRDVAEQSFERDERTKINEAQQVIGASGEFNSLSDLINQRGDEELAVRLAGIDASVRSDFEAREREAAVTAIAGAEGLATNITQTGQLEFTNLIEALRTATGTQTAQTQTGQNVQETITTEEELISKIAELLGTFDETGKTSSTGTGVQSGSTSGTLNELLSSVGSLSGFFGE